jgi:hypothetical protein
LEPNADSRKLRRILEITECRLEADSSQTLWSTTYDCRDCFRDTSSRHLPGSEVWSAKAGSEEPKRLQAVREAYEACGTSDYSQEKQVCRCTSYLQSSLTEPRIDFGVGTPERLSALLDEDALSTANLRRIVIDVSYIDQKKRGILDMRELHEALLKLLLRKEFVGDDTDDASGLFVFF